jgi:hypothetical protein
MRRIILLVLISLIIIALPNPAGEPDKETVIVLAKASYTPYQDEYEKMLYPTVRISTPSGVGSGVVIDVTKVTKVTGCYIITAAHVVDNQSVVNIELYNSTVITGTVVITDTNRDLALLHTPYPLLLEGNKIKSPLAERQRSPAPSGERGGVAGVCYSAHLAPKDYKAYLFAPVWAVGCSLGLPPRPSYGHLCAFAVDNWEISAPVLPGNSGGPVYDAHTYEVIGIAVWVKVYQWQLVTTMAGIVPINEIYEFLDKLSVSSSATGGARK